MMSKISDKGKSQNAQPGELVSGQRFKTGSPLNMKKTCRIRKADILYKPVGTCTRDLFFIVLRLRLRILREIRIIKYIIGEAPGSIVCQLMWSLMWKSGTGLSLFLSASIFPCKNHSTIAPYLFIHHTLHIIFATNRVVKQNNYN